jgi:peptidoglycan/LPS O-acetylase OafA/YrhL
VKRHFQALDGFRGVAALGVVWLHTTEILNLPLRPQMAFMAVDFFFCLSGFVIAYAYEDKLRAHMGLRAFLIERLIRLMPLAVTGAVLGGAVLLVRALVLKDISLVRVVATTCLNAFLIPSGLLSDGRHPEAFPVDPVLWSLFYEVTINIVFGACILYANRVVLIATAVFGGLLIIIATWTWGGLDIGYNWSNLYAGIARVLYPFTAGILVCKLRSRRNTFTLPLVIGLAVILGGPFVGLFGEVVTALLIFPAIIYAGAGAEPTNWVGGACARLGALSYPLYAIDHPLIRLVKFAATRFHHAPPAAVAVLSITLPIGVALALIPIDAKVRAYLKAVFLPVSPRSVVAPSYALRP